MILGLEENPVDPAFINRLTLGEDGWAEETPWPFHKGVPELFRFRDSLIVPNGHALDLGCGSARNAIPIALMGMNVLGIDSSVQCVSEFNRYSEQVACIGANPDVVFRAELGDVFSMDFEEGVYDLILMAQLFVHEPDKGKMVELLNTTTRALKPGGYLWLRTSGTADSEFENFIERANRNPALRYHDCHDVFWEYCGCTGEMKLEPISFLNAGGLAQVVTESGLRIVHSQIGPTKGDANIMYGENWIPEEHRDYGYWLNTRGFITFIAQKPQI